jgi:hypothetical protein
MTDTKQPHAPAKKVEGDGINYRGIIWFVVVLAIVTVTCQIIIWVVLRTMQHNQAMAEAPASPVAPAAEARQAAQGRVYPEIVAIGQPSGPSPKLLVREPENLAAMRALEQESLTTYGWADKTAGSYRIPIDRAKDLLLARGLPVRGQVQAPAPSPVKGKGKQP